MARLNFFERNKDTYQKVSDVPQSIINQYEKVLPEELISIWNNMGLGIYENGFLQLVNPNEYEFVFDYIDKLLEPSVVWAITALGDILIWEGNSNWTISPNEGNRNKFINVRRCNSHVIGGMEFILNYVLGDDYGITNKEYFASKPYLEIKEKLDPLKYGECYGYTPAIVLGGKATIKNIKIVDNKTYIDIIGQAAGKIISLND